MKKFYLLSVLFLVACLLMLNTNRVSSKISSPPAGSTGDPFTSKTCVQGGCHGGSVTTPNANDLTLTIGTGTPTTPLNSSFVYSPNTDYNIAFLINAFTTRYGFQITALDASNEKAGTFAVTNAATTKINTSGPTGTRQYMGHLNASSTKNWTFKWTSPAASTGSVTFYYTYATEDTDGDPDSDVIYAGSVSIEPSLVGIEDISTKIEALRVFPNPVISDLTVTGNMLNTENLEISLYSLDGKVSQQLLNDKVSAGSFSRTFDVANLTSGVYLMQLKSENAATTKKIFVD